MKTTIQFRENEVKSILADHINAKCPGLGHVRKITAYYGDYEVELTDQPEEAPESEPEIVTPEANGNGNGAHAPEPVAAKIEPVETAPVEEVPQTNGTWPKYYHKGDGCLVRVNSEHAIPEWYFNQIGWEIAGTTFRYHDYQEGLLNYRELTEAEAREGWPGAFETAEIPF